MMAFENLFIEEERNYEAMESLVFLEMNASNLIRELELDYANESVGSDNDAEISQLSNKAQKALYDFRSANASGDPRKIQSAKKQVNDIIDDVSALDKKVDEIDVETERERKKAKIRKIVIVIASLVAVAALAYVAMKLKNNKAGADSASNNTSTASSGDSGKASRLKSKVESFTTKFKKKDTTNAEILNEAKNIVEETVNAGPSKERTNPFGFTSAKSRLQQELEDTQFVYNHTPEGSKKNVLGSRIRQLKEQLK